MIADIKAKWLLIEILLLYQFWIVTPASDDTMRFFDCSTLVDAAVAAIQQFFKVTQNELCTITSNVEVMIFKLCDLN